MMMNFSISWLPASLYKAGHCGQVFIRNLVLSEQFVVETKQFHFRVGSSVGCGREHNSVLPHSRASSVV